MRRLTSTAALVAISLVLSGCLSAGGGSGGGTAAALTEPTRPPAATVIAAMEGGLIGGQIGEKLDNSEKQRGLEAEYKALEYTPNGQTVTWRSERSQRYGEVVAGQPYRVGSQDCRQYSHTVFDGGPQRVARGTACRNADGSWTPLS
ncbi:MAG: hypothetical protein AB7S80_16315 [Rhizobiaceae bacterium]